MRFGIVEKPLKFCVGLLNMFLTPRSGFDVSFLDVHRVESRQASQGTRVKILPKCPDGDENGIEQSTALRAKP